MTGLGKHIRLEATNDNITPLARNEFIYWVEDAKQEKAREPHPPENIDDLLARSTIEEDAPLANTKSPEALRSPEAFDIAIRAAERISIAIRSAQPAFSSASASDQETLGSLRASLTASGTSPQERPTRRISCSSRKAA